MIRNEKCHNYHKHILAGPLPLQIRRSDDNCREAPEAAWVSWGNSHTGSTRRSKTSSTSSKTVPCNASLRESSRGCATHQTLITQGWRPLRMPMTPSFSPRFTEATSAAKPTNFFSKDSSMMLMAWKLSLMQLTMPVALPCFKSANLGVCQWNKV